MRFTHEIVDAYLHRRTLTRRETDRHYDKTYVCANSFDPRFRCRRHRRCLSRSRRVGSFTTVRSREELRFLFVLPPFFLDSSRDLPPEVFGFLNANGTRASRPNSNHVTRRVIDRSFEGRKSYFTSLSFYNRMPAIRS